MFSGIGSDEDMANPATTAAHQHPLSHTHSHFTMTTASRFRSLLLAALLLPAATTTAQTFAWAAAPTPAAAPKQLIKRTVVPESDDVRLVRDYYRSRGVFQLHADYLYTAAHDNAYTFDYHLLTDADRDVRVLDVVEDPETGAATVLVQTTGGVRGSLSAASLDGLGALLVPGAALVP